MKDKKIVGINTDASLHDKQLKNAKKEAAELKKLIEQMEKDNKENK